MLKRGSQPNQRSCLHVGPANSGDSKGKVGESGDSKFWMPGFGVKKVGVSVSNFGKKTWKFGFFDTTFFLGNEQSQSFANRNGENLVGHLLRTRHVVRACRIFWCVFHIERWDVARSCVSTPKCVNAHIVGGKRHGKIHPRFGLKKPTPFPSRPPTFLFVLLGRATQNVTLDTGKNNGCFWRGNSFGL